MIKDILLKAASDVEQGMHCKGAWFKPFLKEGESSVIAAFLKDITIEQMEKSQRCAGGSLALSTRLLGGNEDDLFEAIKIVEDEIQIQSPYGHHRVTLYTYNDALLPHDPFAAGQKLSELFRAAADRISE